MATKVIIKKNSYYDSVTLMSLSSKVTQQEGVEEAVVSMATKMNKELIESIGLMTEEVKESAESDLIIAVKTKTSDHLADVIAFVEEQLISKENTNKQGIKANPKTIAAATKDMPEANMAVISVPGEYAAREARLALDQNLHVMLFSDNVGLEDEKLIKEYAAEKGLLVMGPDCGTAIINDVGLCFANNVAKGNIGLVAASGTGLQEVTVQIDRLGGGISQAIGTGGRDLHEAIGGIMMVEGLKALDRDPQTDVIVLISKPPAKKVQTKILSVVKNIQKPVVVSFIEGDATAVQQAGAVFAYSLAETAEKAVELSGVEMKTTGTLGVEIEAQIEQEKNKLKDSQKYIRGLFCGGTLCAETLNILRGKVEPLKSNVAKKREETLESIKVSIGHTLLDLGEDEFTFGKPHPMIEPTLRNERIVQEAQDPEVAVLLFDFELGYGSHEDPVGVSIEAIRKAKEIAEANDRHLAVVAYICGTEKDKQDYKRQENMLKQENVIIAKSNVDAVNIAYELIN